MLYLISAKLKFYSIEFDIGGWYARSQQARYSVIITDINPLLLAVVASSVAVLAWFGLYKFIYKQSLSPGLPGEGIFKYVAWKDPVTQLGRRPGQTCSRHRSSENKWSSKVS